jgi:YVTN family beta-propeller protein
MTAIQSTPGILVIYPPQIPGATTPVISDPPSAPGTALIGLPQSIFTQTATRDGTLAAAVKVRIDPPAHDGKGYDAMSLWLDGVMLESKPIPSSDWDKVAFFDLFESLLRDGRINTLTYKIHRASENERESEPLLILYSRELPGGNDVPGTGDHPGLDISLPAELGDPPLIGKDEVDKGVPVTLFYPFMKAYDKVSLELNRERFTFTLQPGEEGKPYVITITRAMFEQASSHPQFPISYTVVDQLNNPTHKRRWSRIIKADVDLERATLKAPGLSEDLDDPTDDPDTIDLGKLKESLYVQVHLLFPPWVAGDILRISYTCTPPTGPVVTATEELTEVRPPVFRQGKVPAAKVLPDSQVQAIYEQVRDGKVIGTSKPATARVIGEGLPNLQAPRLIKSDNGVLNPLDPANLQGANGQVEVLGFRAGDTVQLIVKGAPGAGSPTFAAKPLNVNNRANFALSNAFIAANMSKPIELSFVLIRGGKSFPSPVLTASVGTIPDNHPSLSTPAMDGAIGKELDVTKMQASDQLRVGEWPQQVSGQCVWLRYDGFDTNGVAIFFEDCKGEPHTALPGLIRPAPIEWLKTLKDGSVLTISFRVNFDGVANTTTAVTFPVRTYTVSAEHDVLTFTNAPYTIAPAGRFNVELLLSTSSNTPVPEGEVSLILPPNFEYANGGSGPRDFITDAVGRLSVRGVKGALIPDSYSLSASSGARVTNATVTVTGLGPVGSISVENLPYGIAVSPDGTRAYVSNADSHTVSVIETATNLVRTTISVGSYPAGVAVSPDGTRAYVGNYKSHTVSVIETATNIVLTTIPTNAPIGIAVSPDGIHAYVCNGVNRTVSVIDTAKNRVLTTIPAGINTYGVAVSPDGTCAYVSNWNSSTVSVIDTATNLVLATITVGHHPSGIAVSPDGTRTYVSIQANDMVSVIDTAKNRVLTTIQVGNSPYGIAVSPDGTRAYVSNVGSNTVSVIDTAKNLVLTTIPAGNQPWGLAISPDGTRAYACLFNSATVSVIDTGR